METRLPNYSIQHQNGEPASGSSSMGNDTKPMVEVSHGCTFDFRDRGARVEQAKATIGISPLGRIWMASPRKEGDRF